MMSEQGGETGEEDGGREGEDTLALAENASHAASQTHAHAHAHAQGVVTQQQQQQQQQQQ